MTSRQLKLARNAHKSVSKQALEFEDDLGWKHPAELIYSTGKYWTDKKLLYYCVANALSVSLSSTPAPGICYVSDGKKTVVVSERYRIPIIYVSRWQWTKLKGLLTANDEEKKRRWPEEKYEVLHIARVWKILTDEGPPSESLNSSYGKEERLEVVKKWKCHTLDRVLTRFRMGCFSSEPTRVEKFWDQYKESEYSKNVLEFDWRNWLSQPRDGVALRETDFISELNPEYLMRGLVEMDEVWLWETSSHPIPDGTPAWSLRGTAGSIFVRQARTSTTKPANSATSVNARVTSKPLSAASDSQTPPRARRTQNTASAGASATAPSPITSSSARPTGIAPTSTSTNTTSAPVTRPIYGPPRPPVTATSGLKKTSLPPKADRGETSSVPVNTSAKSSKRTSEKSKSQIQVSQKPKTKKRSKNTILTSTSASSALIPSPPTPISASTTGHRPVISTPSSLTTVVSSASPILTPAPTPTPSMQSIPSLFPSSDAMEPASSSQTKSKSTPTVQVASTSPNYNSSTVTTTAIDSTNHPLSDLQVLTHEINASISVSMPKRKSPENSSASSSRIQTPITPSQTFVIPTNPRNVRDLKNATNTSQSGSEGTVKLDVDANGAKMNGDEDGSTQIAPPQNPLSGESSPRDLPPRPRPSLHHRVPHSYNVVSPPPVPPSVLTSPVTPSVGSISSESSELLSKPSSISQTSSTKSNASTVDLTTSANAARNGDQRPAKITSKISNSVTPLSPSVYTKSPTDVAASVLTIPSTQSNSATTTGTPVITPFNGVPTSTGDTGERDLKELKDDMRLRNIDNSAESTKPTRPNGRENGNGTGAGIKRSGSPLEKPGPSKIQQTPRNSQHHSAPVSPPHSPSHPSSSPHPLPLRDIPSHPSHLTSDTSETFTEIPGLGNFPMPPSPELRIVELPPINTRGPTTTTPKVLRNTVPIIKITRTMNAMDTSMDTSESETKPMTSLIRPSIPVDSYHPNVEPQPSSKFLNPNGNATMNGGLSSTSSSSRSSTTMSLHNSFTPSVPLEHLIRVQGKGGNKNRAPSQNYTVKGQSKPDSAELDAETFEGSGFVGIKELGRTNGTGSTSSSTGSGSSSTPFSLSRHTLAHLLGEPSNFSYLSIIYLEPLHRRSLYIRSRSFSWTHNAGGSYTEHDSFPATL
ncbi:hypothetical protein F5876DRAFT_65251 [Lentinula aff. lateritia]|uniref:Uncharacterized protein n=1 Tax=Lentinula aff. lateritia TaxID=2804960 RepID=A0ACC1U218_9AGAR|nr:hypothetical protein F5876DRAFT_65251 [Lentinula aff. lateritia]